MQKLVALIYCTFFFWAIAFTNASGQSLKKPLKLIQEGDYPKAKSWLLKELPASPSDAGLNYLAAGCFLQNPAGKALDSAYLFNSQAHSGFETITDKRVKQLKEFGIGDVEIMLQAKKIDSLYFDRFSKVEGTKGFKQYLDLYPKGIFSIIAEDKIYGLDYQKARNGNTIESYRAFVEKYPEAPQSKRALVIIDSLVFIKETASGNLAVLEKFAKENRSHPNRKVVLERIYQFILANCKVDELAGYGINYPESPYNFQAWAMALSFWEGDTDSFFYKYPQAAPREKLRLLHEPLFPIPDTNRITYVDRLGTIRANLPLDTIDVIPCQVVSGPLLFRPKKMQLVLKDGQFVRTTKYAGILNPEVAISIAQNPSKTRFAKAFFLEPTSANGDGPFEIYDFFGKKLLPNKYQQIALVPAGIVAGNKTVGLYNFVGQVLLPDTFVSIRQENGVIEAEGRDTVYSLSADALQGYFPAGKKLKNLREAAILLKSAAIDTNHMADSAVRTIGTINGFKHYGLWYWTKSKKGFQVWKGPVKTASPLVVQAVSVTKEGNIAIMKNDKFGLLTFFGEELPINYSAIPTPYTAKPDLYITQQSGSYGLCSETGKLILPHVFKRIRPWNSKNALVETDSGYMFLSLNTYRPTGSIFKNFRIVQAVEGISVLVFSIKGKYTAISSRSGTIIPAVHAGMEIYSTELGTLIRTADELGPDKVLLSFYNLKGQLLFSKEVPTLAYERQECD